MGFFSKVLNITFLSTFIFYSLKINAKENSNVVNILMNKPEIEDNEYLDLYNSLINDYIINQKDIFPNLSKYKLKFSYFQINTYDDKLSIIDKYQLLNSPYSIDKDYGLYLKGILSELKNSTYDMLILDDQLLYSDVSYINNYIIETEYNFRSLEDYLSRFDNFKLDSSMLQHHNQQFINNDYTKETGIVGLPYEHDFDLIYRYGDTSTSTTNNNGIAGIANTANEKFFSSNNNFENGRYSIMENGKGKGKEMISSNFSQNRYRRQEEINKETVETMKTAEPTKPTETTETTEKLTSSPNRNNTIDSSIGLALSNNNVLINHFVEFVGSQYGIPEGKDPGYYNKFFTNNPENLYETFRNKVLAETDSNINKTLSTTVEEEFLSFIRKEKNSFKGKASYYYYLQKNIKDPIVMSPLPKDISVLTTKYLTINKKSKKEIGDLVLMAIELTSKEMQLFRAKEFGCIPTFDVANSENFKILQTNNYNYSNRDTDNDNFNNKILSNRNNKNVYFNATTTTNNNNNNNNDNENDNNDNNDNDNNNNFINNNNNFNDNNTFMMNTELLDIMKTLKPIDIKKFFYKDEFSANYMEIRLILPSVLRKSLEENNHTLIIYAFNNFMEIKENTFYLKNPPLLFSIFIVFTMTVILSLVMVKIYCNRRHPVLIPISPTLTNLVILGIILNIAFPCFNVVIKDYFLCRMYLVLKFLIQNLIFLPILTMAFRIFYIFNNSRVVDGRKLNDKRLLIFIAIVVIILFFFTLIISLTDQLYLKTTGTLLEDRIYWCNFDDCNNYSIFTNVYYGIIVSFFFLFIYIFIYFYFILQLLLLLLLLLTKKKKKKTLFISIYLFIYLY